MAERPQPPSLKDLMAALSDAGRAELEKKLAVATPQAAETIAAPSAAAVDAAKAELKQKLEEMLANTKPALPGKAPEKPASFAVPETPNDHADTIRLYQHFLTDETGSGYRDLVNDLEQDNPDFEALDHVLFPPTSKEYARGHGQLRTLITLSLAKENLDLAIELALIAPESETWMYDDNLIYVATSLVKTGAVTDISDPKMKDVLDELSSDLERKKLREKLSALLKPAASPSRPLDGGVPASTNAQIDGPVDFEDILAGLSPATPARPNSDTPTLESPADVVIRPLDSDEAAQRETYERLLNNPAELVAALSADFDPALLAEVIFKDGKDLTTNMLGMAKVQTLIDKVAGTKNLELAKQLAEIVPPNNTVARDANLRFLAWRLFQEPEWSDPTNPELSAVIAQISDVAIQKQLRDSFAPPVSAPAPTIVTGAVTVPTPVAPALDDSKIPATTLTTEPIAKREQEIQIFTLMVENSLDEAVELLQKDLVHKDVITEALFGIKNSPTVDGGQQKALAIINRAAELKKMGAAETLVKSAPTDEIKKNLKEYVAAKKKELAAKDAKERAAREEARAEAEKNRAQAIAHKKSAMELFGENFGLGEKMTLGDFNSTLNIYFPLNEAMIDLHIPGLPRCSLKKLTPGFLLGFDRANQFQFVKEGIAKTGVGFSFKLERTIGGKDLPPVTIESRDLNQRKLVITLRGFLDDVRAAASKLEGAPTTGFIAVGEMLFSPDHKNYVDLYVRGRQAAKVEITPENNLTINYGINSYTSPAGATDSEALKQIQEFVQTERETAVTDLAKSLQTNIRNVLIAIPFDGPEEKRKLWEEDEARRKWTDLRDALRLLNCISPALANSTVAETVVETAPELKIDAENFLAEIRKPRVPLSRPSSSSPSRSGGSPDIRSSRSPGDRPHPDRPPGHGRRSEPAPSSEPPPNDDSAALLIQPAIGPNGEMIDPPYIPPPADTGKKPDRPDRDDEDDDEDKTAKMRPTTVGAGGPGAREPGPTRGGAKPSRETDRPSREISDEILTLLGLERTNDFAVVTEKNLDTVLKTGTVFELPGAKKGQQNTYIALGASQGELVAILKKDEKYLDKNLDLVKKKLEKFTKGELDNKVK